MENKNKFPSKIIEIETSIKLLEYLKKIILLMMECIIFVLINCYIK